MLLRAVFLVTLILRASFANADEPWRKINDALFATLVDPLGSSGPQILYSVRVQELWTMLEAAGDVQRGVATLALGPDGEGRPREFDTRTVMIGEAALTLLSGGVDDAPAGLHLRLSEADQEIPGLRGRLSNCSEINETECEELNFSRSGALTLGLASCMCQGAAVSYGHGMIALNCYFGRGGTYMDYALAYGPINAGLRARLLNDLDLTARREICRSSAAAKRYPQFLLDEGETLSPEPLSADIELPLRYLASTTSDAEDWGKDMVPVTILQKFFSD